MKTQTSVFFAEIVAAVKELRGNVPRWRNYGSENSREGRWKSWKSVVASVVEATAVVLVKARRVAVVSLELAPTSFHQLHERTAHHLPNCQFPKPEKHFLAASPQYRLSSHNGNPRFLS